jgi:hypothetical protein
MCSFSVILVAGKKEEFVITKGMLTLSRSDVEDSQPMSTLSTVFACKHTMSISFLGGGRFQMSLLYIHNGDENRATYNSTQTSNQHIHFL